jgi:hypothetical protein
MEVLWGFDLPDYMVKCSRTPQYEYSQQKWKCTRIQFAADKASNFMSYRHYRFTFISASNIAVWWMHTAHNTHSRRIAILQFKQWQTLAFISLGLPSQFQLIWTTAPTSVSSQSETHTHTHRRRDSADSRAHPQLLLLLLLLLWLPL